MRRRMTCGCLVMFALGLGWAPAVTQAARTVVDQPLAALDPAAVAAKVDPYDEGEGSVRQDAGVVAVAAGEGAVAWAVRVARGSFALWAWTGGEARLVATLPEDRKDVWGPYLEVGRTPSGYVVAVASRWHGAYGVRLVRVDDGTVVEFPGRVAGGRPRQVAIDNGRAYATRNVMNRKKQVPRGKASLWQAPIDGLTVGAFSRLRASTHTEGWGTVVADRGRIAVSTWRDVHDADAPSVFGEESWLVGRPHGRWLRSGYNIVSDYGYVPLNVIGFTRDRGAFVAVENDDLDPSPATVTRVPLRKGVTFRKLPVTNPLLTDETVIAYDGSRDRLVVVGPDATGTIVVGLAHPHWKAPRKAY